MRFRHCVLVHASLDKTGETLVDKIRPKVKRRFCRAKIIFLKVLCTPRT